VKNTHARQKNSNGKLASFLPQGVFQDVARDNDPLVTPPESNIYDEKPNLQNDTALSTNTQTPNPPFQPEPTYSANLTPPADLSGLPRPWLFFTSSRSRAPFFCGDLGWTWLVLWRASPSYVVYFLTFAIKVYCLKKLCLEMR